MLDSQINLSEIIDIISAIVTITVMIIGIRAINRVQAKTEDAAFGFYSRFLVYLELLLDAIGTRDKSVFFYQFTDDSREKTYGSQTPSSEELKQFKVLVNEILVFLMESNEQIAFSEIFYNKRKILTKFLIKKCKSLGDYHRYANNDQTQLHKEIDDKRKLINEIIIDIEYHQKTILFPLWKKNERKKKDTFLTLKTLLKKILKLS